MTNFSEITINYKPLLPFLTEDTISSSKDVYEILSTYWSEKLGYKEEFYILLLNTANKPLGISKISEGGLAGTVVDVKMIFQAALKANASSIILAHNHPSGNLKPSDQDLKITKKIVEAGRLMDVKVLDHLILTYNNGYYSFSDEGDL